MTQEQFKAESRYRTAMSVAKAMLARGLINQGEYKKIDTIMLKKYRPILGSLQAGI
jgi:uncharacterized membrane protein